MILNFKLSNFKSFNEIQGFSFLVQKRQGVKILPKNYTEIDGRKVLKSMVLFGANASGKSNLIKGLEWFKNFVLSSFKNANDNTGIDFDEFLLNQKNQNLPATFELIFLLDKHEYVYNFSVNKSDVVREELKIVYKSVKTEKIIYSRNKNKVDVVSKNETRLTAVNILKNNVLFLSVLSASGDELANKIIDKIRKIGVVKNSRELEKFVGYSLSNYQKYKTKIDQMMCEADFGINSIKVKSEDLSDDEKLEILQKDGVSIKFKEILKNGKGEFRKNYVLTSHFGLNSVGGKIEIDFDLQKESDGTQRMFNLSGPIANTLDEGRLLVVDELDAHLHTDLCKFILLQFHLNNLTGAQLLFSSHSVSLLDKNILRRDQILFAEKNKQSESELFSLASLSERDNADYAKRYMEGRYGALPYISQLEKYEDENT